MPTNIDAYDYFEKLDGENIMLSFKGDLTQDLLNSILELVEEKMVVLNAPSLTKKRVFNVLVECLQNLFHHRNKNAENVKDSAIIIMVASNAEGYSVITGNYVPTEAVEKLKGRIQEINGLDGQELKSLYKQVLANGQYSEKGGGGLGIIDIARRSGEKLDYGFVPVDEFNSFFSLNVKISN